MLSKCYKEHSGCEGGLHAGAFVCFLGNICSFANSRLGGFGQVLPPITHTHTHTITTCVSFLVELGLVH